MRLRNKVTAAIRNAVAARLTRRRVPRASTLSPLVRLSVHNPSYEEKCASGFHQLMSSPTSLTMGYHHVDAADPRQVYSRDTLQFAAELESRGILGWFYLFSLWFLFYRLERNNIRETRQVLLQLLIALGDPLLVGVVHR